MDIQWSRFIPEQSPFWEQNFKYAIQKIPSLEADLDQYRKQLKSLEFFRLGQGEYLCREFQSQFQFYPAANFRPHLQQSLQRILNYYSQGLELAVIAGSALGYLAHHVQDHIQGDLKKGILLLENRPELLLAQLALFDCSRLLTSQQIYWIYTEDITTPFQQLLQQEALYLLNSRKVFMVSERLMTPQEQQNYQNVAHVFQTVQNQLLPQEQKGQDFFREQMKQPPDLHSGTIWSVVTPDAYVHTPMMKALTTGFEQAGWRQRVLEVRDGFSTRFKISRHLVDSAPDLMLVCNTPSSSLISAAIRRPRICWMLDHPQHFSMNLFHQKTTPQDFIFYIDRSYAPYFEGLNAAVHQYLPACPSLLQTGQGREEFRAPIMFVGSYLHTDSLLQGMSDRQKEEALNIADLMLRQPLLHAVDFLKRETIPDTTVQTFARRAQQYTRTLMRTFSDDDARINYFFYTLANGVKRERFIKALLPYGLVIYGPDSWLRLLGGKHARQFRGWLPYHDLADAYASADVCLNIHSIQCPTCLNPRDFDVLMAKGCLLSDYVEDMDSGLLQDGEDLIVYADVDQLITRAHELLENPELRQVLREQGHRTCMAAHTPRHRAEAMLQVIHRRFQFLSDGVRE
ncbi:MAG: CgeB family protein [bacterium]|jgi:hypothetical protein